MLLLLVLIDGTQQGWLSGNSVPEQRNFLKENEMWILISGYTTDSEKSHVKLFSVFREERGKNWEQLSSVLFGKVLSTPLKFQNDTENATMEAREHSNYIWKYTSASVGEE